MGVRSAAVWQWSVVAALLPVFGLGDAYGQPAAGVVSAGPQADPPGPAMAERALEMDEGGRRAIRGCRVDGLDCSEDPIPGLVEFEREAFPRPGRDSPWSETPHRMKRRRGASASELRPDLPWLKDLVMPDLPITWDHRLIKFLEFYRNDPRGRRLMRAWLRDQGRYRDMIVRELRRAKLPRDLLYVAMIESSYDATEYSRVGAAGLWQFMPAGGSIYGLEQNRWIDERNDPVLSTRAACEYWRDLYQRFGDWHLAMAAYNAGYGAVLRSIAKYNSNNFWRLLDYENALPWESQTYVPKALAAAIVGRNREAFGFGDVVDAHPMLYDEITLDKSVSLSVVARAASTDVDTIRALNPQLRRGRTPPGQRYRLRIPRGRMDGFATRFAQLRGEWDRFDAYVVKHGQRVEDIAMEHGISTRKLLQLNELSSQREVDGGMVIVVPRVSEQQKVANRAEAEQDLYSSSEPRGQDGEPLLVPLAEPDAEVPGKSRVFYRVVTGDSLYRIARVFAVDRHQLADWNGLDAEAKLHPRMVLQVWVEPGFDADKAGVKLLDPGRLELVAAASNDHLDQAEELIGRERQAYTAERKESYEQIGKKYGLTARDLARINGKPHSTVLEPGETCTVYRVVDRKASDRAADQAKAARRGRK